MVSSKSQRALVEVFGFDPIDHTGIARKYWELKACPFIRRACTKYDHTNEICYGTCSVTNSGKNVIICPNRLYADNYATIRNVGKSVFGEKKFLLFNDFINESTLGTLDEECVVALGHNSGKEVKVDKMSMDWILAYIKNGVLQEYVGIEVQSIDITGNYRDAWYAARDGKNTLPASQHGLNWANVHKRLIPQIIRKSLIYSKSALVKHGLYFIVPEQVYQRFEEIIGSDIPLVRKTGQNVITVHTYDLGDPVPHGECRKLRHVRNLSFTLEEFSTRFISGPNLPESSMLDNKIKEILAVR